MYRLGYYHTKMFVDDSDGSAENQLAGFLNHLNDNSRTDYQDFQIENISMSVDNGRTNILLIWKYV